MATRDERSAENQQRFNTANELLREAVKVRASSEQLVPFLCECADDRCHGRVELTVDQFEDMHEDENVYVVIPSHPRINGEVVLRREDGFEQVQKPDE